MVCQPEIAEFLVDGRSRLCYDGSAGIPAEVMRVEVYERIRYLRRDVLHMTMEEFGGRICVSRDVINNIERNRLAHIEQKRYLVKLIALEFGVREEWLLTGDEPMIQPPPFFSFDTYLKEQKASDMEIAMVKAYFSVPPEARREIAEKLYEAALNIHDARSI